VANEMATPLELARYPGKHSEQSVKIEEMASSIVKLERAWNQRPLGPLLEPDSSPVKHWTVPIGNKVSVISWNLNDWV
jgi:hypothetical protein